MRTIRGFYGALALCVSAGLAAVLDLTNRFVETIFETLAPSPQLALVHGDDSPPAYWSPVSFADPRVERHEAGLARLGSVRHT